MITTEEHKIVGEKLRKARKDLRLTQRQVAKFLHCDHSVISQIELGRRTVSFLEILRLAEIYKKPVIWFMPVVPSYLRLVVDL